MIRCPFGMQQVLHVWTTLQETALFEYGKKAGHRDKFMHQSCTFTVSCLHVLCRDHKKDLNVDTLSKLEGEINNSDLKKLFGKQKASGRTDKSQ